ncbi:CFEM domain containing protein [Pyrenophora tritici-repentis]|nr:CFEM domain containing protein [Pyrenophora tritici-repentis]
MRFSQITAILSITAVASAQVTFNLTKAYKKGNWDKYHCLDAVKVKTWIPKCLHECQDKANRADGCAFNDYACHCINNSVYSKLIEPCAFPASMGGKGTCKMADLRVARPIVQDICNFFNATIYSDYHGCKQKLSREKTFGMVRKQKFIAIDSEYDEDRLHYETD